MLEGGPIAQDEVLGHLDRMLDRISSESGIDFAVREPRLRVRPNGSLEGRIYYRGPRNAPNPASVRLDLTRDEQVARPPVMRPIQHLYSDQLPEPATVRCYSLEEVYAEKIRAMGERGRPRDLYDIVFLLDYTGLVDQPELISETLITKCESKGVPVPTLERLQESPHRVELESEWVNMLGHQLPALPPLDHYWDRLPELFRWLDGELEVELPGPAAGAAGEMVWSPSPAAWSWGSGPALEPVRFAGANRLCVDLGYRGTVRQVEPYSLRVTRDGNLLLYAIRRDNRQLRSYRVDRMQSIEITTEPFTPVRLVEFRQVGPLAAPPTTRRSVGGRGTSSARPYRVECAACGKTFARSRPGTRLKAHKDPDGFPCPG